MLMTNAIATTEDMVARDAKPAGSHTYPNGRWQSVVFQPSDFATPDDHFSDARRILDAAVAILAQGEDLLCALSAESYTRRVPAAFNACIGGHYRHCLDHFTSLLRGLDADEVDYDHRDRDLRIESTPPARHTGRAGEGALRGQLRAWQLVCDWFHLRTRTGLCHRPRHSSLRADFHHGAADGCETA